MYKNIREVQQTSLNDYIIITIEVILWSNTSGEKNVWIPSTPKLRFIGLGSCLFF